MTYVDDDLRDQCRCHAGRTTGSVMDTVDGV